MMVRDLVNAWVWRDGDYMILIGTSGNKYGDEIKWRGDMGSIGDSGFMETRVLNFATDFINGTSIISIIVDAKTVPICVLKGFNYSDWKYRYARKGW